MALNNEKAVAQQIHSLLRQPGDVRWQPHLVNNGSQHPSCFDPEWDGLHRSLECGFFPACLAPRRGGTAALKVKSGSSLLKHAPFWPLKRASLFPFNGSVVMLAPWGGPPCS